MRSDSGKKKLILLLPESTNIIVETNNMVLGNFGWGNFFQVYLPAANPWRYYKNTELWSQHSVK